MFKLKMVKNVNERKPLESEVYSIVVANKTTL